MRKRLNFESTTCTQEKVIYLTNIIDDSVIMCDKIIGMTKTFPTNFDEKKSNL